MNLKKIAELTGVHPSTVARAVNDDPRVTQETRETIKKAAEDNGYIRDALAKSLIEGKTFTLGVIVPEVSSSFYSRIINEIENEVSKSGYSLIIAATDFRYEKEKKAIQTILAKRVVALVLCAISERAIEEHRAQLDSVPVVLCDIASEGDYYDCVYVDEKRGILEAVEYLKKLGHSKIAYIAEQGITQRRMDIFIKAMETWICA